MFKFKKSMCVIFTIIIMLTGTSAITAYAATENQIRNKIVSVASDEVGYEGTSSYSKYGDWYGYQGGWCTTFALWCYNKAGASLGVSLYGNVTPSGGNCNSMISWYQNKGRYHTRGDGYTPKTGDLIFFDWSGNGSSQHVGIVDYISGSTVHTIEGNCSGIVKAREYTTTGSKPYNNVSSIMGYASPDFSSVANGSDSNTTKNNTTKKQTTSKPNTTVNHTTVQTTANYTNNVTTAAPTTTTTTTTTTTEPTSEFKKVEKLELSASEKEMKVGDTVKLSYKIEPADTQAVVGYFCDEEDIIRIDSGGDITAIGEGEATVVVCVNDELYNQCAFKVSDAVAEVTTLSSNTTRRIVGKVVSTTSQNDAKSVLTKMGINVNALSQNKRLYIIPASIICFTAFVSIIISIAKKNKNSSQ